MGGNLSCPTLVTPIGATPEAPLPHPHPPPVDGQLRQEAPCLGRAHNPALACGEGWVGTTCRLFLNLAGNSLREFAK